MRIIAIPANRGRHRLTVHLEDDGPVAHSDTIDIHNDRQRQRFVGRVASLLHIDPRVVDDQLHVTMSVIESTELESLDDEDSPQQVPYVICDGCMCLDGERPAQIANFTAEITEELVYDDGAEQTRYFIVCGVLATGESMPQIRISAAEYEAMEWVLPNWGSTAIVAANRGARDHVRAAIQHFSGDVPTRTVYSHLGWRRVGDSDVYLHAAGAIGAGGHVTGIETDLPISLRRFSLPIPECTEIVAAIQASLDFLLIGLDLITVPLLGAVYRSVLGPADFSVHLTGPTGVFKSELAALVQQHFGAEMNSRNLPANWSATSNALIEMAFHAKDCVLVIDEFHPTGSSAQVSAAHEKADSVLRAQGNRAGRERMRSDCSLRPARPPRGLILSTGEEDQRGESLTARTLVDNVAAGDIDVARLTVAQQRAADGLYAQSMAGYIQWIAQTESDLPHMVRDSSSVIREEILSAGIHARTPWIIANLLLGIRCFLEFAVARGAISREESLRIGEHCKQVLIQLIATQQETQSTSDPVRRFLDLVRSMLSTGRARLQSLDRSCADTAHQSSGSAPSGTVPVIGWIVAGDVYLDPDESYAAAQLFANDQGEPLGTDKRALYRRMRDAQYLVIEESQGGISHRLPSPHRHRRGLRLIPGLLDRDTTFDGDAVGA